MSGAFEDPVGAEPELRIAEIQPAGDARVVGPGRREREYLGRIARLEGAVVLERERQVQVERELEARGRELEVSQRIERGAQLRLDRIEQRFDAAIVRERRLATLVGALQRENELLRERVELLAVAERKPLELAARRTPEPPRGFLARWFARPAGRP